MDSNTAILVTDRTLVPASTGNRVRIVGLIRALRRLGSRVVLVGANLGSAHALESLVDRVVYVHARSFSGGSVADFDSAPYRDRLAQVVREEFPRVVIAEYAWLGPALRAAPECVSKWIDCHDVLHERTLRFRAAGLASWTVCSSDEEVELLSEADTVLAIQEREASVLRRLLPSTRVVCVFPAIDLPHGFELSRSSDNGVLAVGGRHAGNDGIRRFARDGWRHVVDRLPAARLRIVGAIGTEIPIDGTINVVGEVGNLSSYYREAAAVACPVFTGTGATMKMVEALRYGKAVVATPTAVEGFPRCSPTPWACVDSVLGCAAEIVALLTDDERRHALETAAFAYAEQYFSARALDEMISRLLPRQESR